MTNKFATHTTTTDTKEDSFVSLKGRLFSLDRADAGIDTFTDGEDSHDGYPGGLPTATHYHGTAGGDDIKMLDIAFDQQIYGFAGDDTILAGHGDDLIVGGLGNDQIMGNGGRDTVVGGEGNDLMDGGLEDDELHAGDGEDSVSGGAGDDFIFLTDDDQRDEIGFIAGHGVDVIDGFETGVDQVRLQSYGFETFNEINALITYNDDNQALLDLGGGDMLIFTGLDGPLGWEDFIL